jgi:predicted phosphodiesterase
MKLTLVVISDTHGKLSEISVPPGDVLIHCGDFCKFGSMEMFEEFCSEFAQYPHQNKLVIAGNHEYMLFGEREERSRKLFGESVTYLRDDGVSIEGLRFFGVAWRSKFSYIEPVREQNSPGRFSEPPLTVWDTIPAGVDVLITHNPPWKILDATPSGSNIGSRELKDNLSRIKPMVHCFGHVHSSYGHRQIGETLYVNAANVNEDYEPANQPIVVEIENGIATVRSVDDSATTDSSTGQCSTAGDIARMLQRLIEGPDEESPT